MSITIGIIGYGSIGKRHAENFIRLGCNIRAWDPLNSGINTPDDWLDASTCDGVVIASPSDKHYQQINAIQTQKFNGTPTLRPMLVEKPICTDIKDLYYLKPDNISMVGYNLRFHSCVKKAREWLGVGYIGRPLWAQFHCAQYNDKPAYEKDGLILNWSHEIDLAIHLLGQADFVTSAFVCSGIAEVILNHMNSGCLTAVHLDYVTKPERRGFTIVGTEGSIDADLLTRQIYRKDPSGWLCAAYHGKDNWDENYLEEAQTFLDILLDRPAFPDYCTAEQAIEVARICMMAKEHAK